MTLTETPNCYWTRLRGFDSGLDDIIASRIGSGHQVVTIEARDAAIDSVDCGTWTSDLAGVVLERGEFSAGTYVVGLHVEPATYVATVADQCEWARLSGFGGTRREVIERGSARRGVPPFVTIEPRDLGFTSDGCGTWERQAP